MATYTWTPTTDTTSLDTDAATAHTATVTTDSPTLDTDASTPHTATVTTDATSLDTDAATPHTATTFDEVHFNGIVVPGAFYRVLCRVVDPSGDPLPEVKWVMSAGTFPTASPVDDDAYTVLYLLPTTYSTFMAIAEDDTPQTQFIDYAWYSEADNQDPISPLALGPDEVPEVVLDPQRIEPGSSGLNMAGEVHFG